MTQDLDAPLTLNGVALYPKREWVGLTDSEVDNIVAYPWGETKNWIKAVEAALKEKNT